MDALSFFQFVRSSFVIDPFRFFFQSFKKFEFVRFQNFRSVSILFRSLLNWTVIWLNRSFCKIVRSVKITSFFFQKFVCPVKTMHFSKALSVKAKRSLTIWLTKKVRTIVNNFKSFVRLQTRCPSLIMLRMYSTIWD